MTLFPLSSLFLSFFLVTFLFVGNVNMCLLSWCEHPRLYHRFSEYLMSFWDHGSRQARQVCRSSFSSCRSVLLCSSCAFHGFQVVHHAFIYQSLLWKKNWRCKKENVGTTYPFIQWVGGLRVTLPSVRALKIRANEISEVWFFFHCELCSFWATINNFNPFRSTLMLMVREQLPLWGNLHWGCVTG